MKKFTVSFPAEGVEILVEKNTSLQQVIIEQGLDMEFPCGGVGACKRCQVKIKSPGEKDFRAQLACQTKVNRDLIVEIPGREKTTKILLEGMERAVKLSPLIRRVRHELTPPTLEDNQDDFSRLLGKKKKTASLKILQELPIFLRKNKFKVTALVTKDEILALEPFDAVDTSLGVAFDIGTTTIAGYLINLKTGEEITRFSALNPQTKYGADLISRIVYTTENKDGLKRLNGEVIHLINQMIDDATAEHGYSAKDVVIMTAAGNTAMHHLLLNIPPRNLAGSPYVPVVKQAVIADAKELGIQIHPSGKLYTFPNIAGYVGGDTVAASLSCEMHKSKNLALLIDIGTNGEIVLGANKKLLSCSVAAGPAFEGVEIECGMRGAQGAVDHAFITEDGSFAYSVIGDTQPKGIAGSGIVDILAVLLDIGVIDKNGKILKPDRIRHPIGKKISHQIKEVNGKTAFVIFEHPVEGAKVYLTQKDVREFQLAKSAIASGVQILLAEYPAKVEDIHSLYIAGAFGTYLNHENACRVGMFPEALLGRTVNLGNAAGTGARLALLSNKEYEESKKISEKIMYIELSSHPDFNETFLKNLGFKAE